MKTKLQMRFLLLFLATTIISYGQSVATLPAYESFDYVIGTKLIEDDATVGVGFWSTTGPRAGDILAVASPSWSTIANIDAPQGNAIQFQGSGLKPEFLFTPQTDPSATTYSSFLMKVTDFSSLDATASRFIGLGALNSGGSISGATHIFVRIDAGGTGFNLGYNATSSTTGLVWNPTVFVADQEIMIVMYHDNTNSATNSKVWINPTVGGLEPTPTWTGGPRNLSVDRIHIYQHSSVNTPDMILDELRTGTTWTGATKQSILSTSDIEVSKLNMYPNPIASGGNLFIDSSSNNEKEVIIYSLLGKVVHKEVTHLKAINLPELTSGTYLINITENNKTVTKKLLIK